MTLGKSEGKARVPSSPSVHHPCDIGGGVVGEGVGREAGVGHDALRLSEAQRGVLPGDLE